MTTALRPALLIACALSLFLAAACRGTFGALPVERLFADWRLVAVEGEPLGEVEGLSEAPTLSIEPGGQIAGFAGVNRMSGAVVRHLLDEGRFAPGPLAVTRMAGPPAAMELERRYLELLAGANGWQLVGGMLVLEADGREVLRFARL